MTDGFYANTELRETTCGFDGACDLFHDWQVPDRRLLNRYRASEAPKHSIGFRGTVRRWHSFSENG